MSVVACPNPSNYGNGGVTSFPGGCIAVTPHDTNTFAVPIAVFRVDIGTLVVVPANGGSAVTLTDWPPFVVVPFLVSIVTTGSAAGDIFGAY